MTRPLERRRRRGQRSYWEAVVGKAATGSPGRGGYLLADKGPAAGVGMWRPEEFGGDMQVGWAADTVGHMPVGTARGVADKSWGEDTHLVGLPGTDHHASTAAWVPHRLLGSMGHCMAPRPGQGALAHI